jgi:hypothetical protein
MSVVELTGKTQNPIYGEGVGNGHLDSRMYFDPYMFIVY